MTFFFFIVFLQSYVAKFLWTKDLLISFNFIFLVVSGFLPTQKRFMLSKLVLFFAYVTVCNLEVSSLCSKLPTVILSLGESWLSLYPGSMAVLTMLVIPEVTIKA